MAINSKIFDYLAQWIAEGMEKAHEEMRKYDELKQWRDKFEANMVFIPQSCNQVLGEYTITNAPLLLPKNIQQIILSALDAEIKKLDEE